MTIDPATLSAIKDLGIGAFAIAALAWIIVQLMQWQLKERQNWTAKVEEWGKSQKEDRDLLVGVVDKVSTVLQRFADSVEDEQKEKEAAREAMRKKVDGLTDTVDQVKTQLAQHRDATEAGQAHKRPQARGA